MSKPRRAKRSRQRQWDRGDRGPMEKILVSLPENIASLIDNDLKSKLGDGRSDIIRATVMNWLGEKGYLSRSGKDGKK
ncbi:MAG: hypothetical protein ACRECH_07715 [Nitrososphaerales archaeon]